ncbi:MAG: adenylate/guanylate cyclase domain-containing protein, partial [Planctomycetota bacterium]
MQCPKCQFENPEGSKFCLDCGQKFELRCPHCDKALPVSANFCNECGNDLTKPIETAPIDFSEPQSYTPKFLADKILTSRNSIEGEHKLVTVLFADVANYTSMSERLDPEEIHQIMDGCFKILMDEIHSYEGTINQFTGDGVMALFGAPVAHEDHAQRACYAALSIQKALDEYGVGVAKDTAVEFKMRIGVNTGKVIVGAIGDDLRMDYTAVGDTTNLAARIQQTAKPGEVWLSRETQSIIKGFFQVESAGDHVLKGKAEKQSVHRLLAERKEVRTRFEAGLARGVTGLVGRRSEMQILRTAWERARSGKARLVDVVGEAGVGKSRLIYEFQKTITDEATVLTGVCIHYGRNINFLPLIDIVRTAFNIEEGMSEEDVGRRIQEKATDDLGKMIPFYRNLLSLKVDDKGFNSLNPEGRKFGTFEAVKNLLLSISESKPLVVFIEDVHWIDKISEEFFVFFSHSIQGQMILMLSAYRPEGAPGWAKGPYYRHLGLETLSEKSSGHLVRNILGGPKLDPVLEKLIVDRTGGNPFFVEEMVRELMERNELMKEG